MRYRGKNVLVIGGTGFVGGRLAERLLLEEGASVRVLVRDWNRAVWISRTTAELVPGDLLDRSSLADAVRDCDIVFHCASGSAPDGGYQRTNIDGTRNVIDACQEAQVKRCVYVSSVAVHGPNPPSPLNENAPLVVMGRDYSDSKVAAEKLLLEAFEKEGFPVVIIRPTFVWGPRSNLFTVRQLLEMHRGKFKYVDQGEGSCNAVYIDHLVDALLSAGFRDSILGRAFLITDGFDISWADFFGYYQKFLLLESLPTVNSKLFVTKYACRSIDRLRDLLMSLQGTPAPFLKRVVRRMIREVLVLLENRYMSEWDMLKYARMGAADISLARNLLEYGPSYSLETAMRETLAWVVDQMGYELGLTPLEESQFGGEGNISWF